MKTKLRFLWLIFLLAFSANAHVISSAGCTSNDQLHFNPAGSREFGRRYGEKMLSLIGRKVDPTK